MAINTLEYAKIFQKELDQQIVEGATSGWMEDNAGQVKYSGGNEVKIPTISTQGLGDYDRDNGFVRGAVTLSYETYKMTQDRARTFSLDAMDVDESNFIANAGNVMGVFQTEHVIPEIDSYRYSKIFALAKAGGKVTEGYTVAKATVVEKLKADIQGIRNTVSLNADLVIIMSPITAGILSDALENSRRIDIGNFKQGEIDLTIKKFDGLPIIEVPSARLKTLYKKQDGKTVGQEAGGLVADTNAKDINWIITSKNVPIAVSKTDLTRIFTPMVNQQADAWKIDYRKYHDIWIPKQRLSLIRACSN
jgi:lj928 prophage protein|nr:MAG TPA: major capsid protein [Caudoviricetes sp.]